MINNNCLKFLSALVLSTLLYGPGLAAKEDPFRDVEISTTRVTPQIYMLTGSGGNIGVFTGKDGVFLIDDQFAPLTEKIRTAIGKISDQPVRFVLNTHWHPDHTGGNENFGKAGSVIVSHDNVRKRLTTDSFIKMFRMDAKAVKPAGLPIITFNDEMTFHLNGDEIAIRHVAQAHTDGDSIVHFHKANVIHAGDTCFSGMYPFIDTDSGGSVTGYIQAVSAIVDMADDKTVIIPGHGPILDKKALTAWRDMLVTLSDHVRAAIGQGKSLEEILADWPTEPFDEDYSGGAIDGETFVRVIFEDLSQGDS